MNKKILIVVFACFVLSLSLLDIQNIREKNKKDTFSCDNIGIIYAKKSEMKDISPLKDKGIIIYYKELDSYSAKTEVLECPNIDLYLGHLK